MTPDTDNSTLHHIPRQGYIYWVSILFSSSMDSSSTAGIKIEVGGVTERSRNSNIIMGGNLRP